MEMTNIEFMWECEWNKIKNDLPNKHELEIKASKQHIRIRDGRTEACRSYVKCNKYKNKSTWMFVVYTQQLMLWMTTP